MGRFGNMFTSQSEIDHKQTVQDYKRVFGSPEGKRVFADLCNRFHFLEGHKGDPHKEGGRAVVLHIIKMRATSLEQIEALLQGDTSA